MIGGPTGSGKSQLALEIALRFRGEIINADSRQIYRDLIIGTNQPSVEEMRLVPHHLFGFLNPAVRFSAPDYERLAAPLVTRIASEGKIPVLVGGTGFYMKALLRGTWSIPSVDEKLRARLKKIERRRGKQFLHRFLKRIDPLSASRIEMNDTYRVIRALEIFFQTGKTRSALQPIMAERFQALKYCLEPERSELQKRIKERTEVMFQNGWIEEVKGLLQRYPDFDKMPAANSLGYFEIIRFLNGETDLEACRSKIVQKTTQYAKRQLTWFRNQDQFIRLNSLQELHKMLDSVLQ